MSTKIVVIVAAGSGTRMNNATPKQFLEINGMPLLMHTIFAFYNALQNDFKLILVVSNTYIKYSKNLIESYLPNLNFEIVEGGTQRFYSVQNAIKKIPTSNNTLVAIHDAARPLVSTKTILNTFENAQENGNSIPVMSLQDSIRKVKNNNSSEAQDRSFFKLVQTPQVFKVEQLQKAYNTNFTENFTDDASVVEAMGFEIHLCEGNVENIKITSPIDLEIASILLTKK
jgi:2-C-methyl-D-erythritol 4-phosphate cytidylyltransferase